MVLKMDVKKIDSEKVWSEYDKIITNFTRFESMALIGLIQDALKEGEE